MRIALRIVFVCLALFLIYLPASAQSLYLSGNSKVVAGETTGYRVGGGSCSNASYSWSVSQGTYRNETPEVISVTWYVNPNGSTGSVYVSNNCGQTGSMTVTIIRPITPGVISPETQDVLYNSGQPQTISITPHTGGDATYTYQWQKNDGTQGWLDIPGANGTSYTPPKLTESTSYRVMISSYTLTAYSEHARVNVTALPLTTGDITPLTQSIAYGATPSPLVCSNATGGRCLSYAYQWQSSTDNTNFTDIASATGKDYTPPVLSGTTYFRRRVVCGYETKYTPVSTITVAAPQINGGTAAPASQTIVYGAAATISCTAATGGSCGTSYVYQWERSPDGIAFTPVQGATSQNYPIAAVTTSDYFRRKTTCGSLVGYSNIVKVNVNILPLSGGTLSTQNEGIIYNNAPVITASNASGSTCNAAGYVYSWELDSYGDQAGWTTIGSGSSYPGTKLTAGGKIRRKVTCGSTVTYSNELEFYIVLLPLDPGVITPSAVVVNSGTGITLSGTAAKGGGCPSYTYTYEQSFDGLSWTAISGSSIGNITRTTYVRRLVVCADMSAYSNTVIIRIAQPVTVNTPNAVTTPASNQTEVPMPAYPTGTSTTDLNFVRTRDYKKPVQDAVTARGLTDKADVSQVTEYLDGLGRTQQSVAKAITPLGMDMISTTWYDAYGRVVNQYLPYTDNLATGLFRLDPGTKQKAFYNTIFNNIEGFYYSNTVYENSPLGIPVKVSPPGKSWAGSGRGSLQEQKGNGIYEDVRIWYIAEHQDSLPRVAGVYPAGSLMVSIATDERENRVAEYRNKEGMLVLKKVQISNALEPAHSGWLCTYYVYDHMRNLRFIIPPLAVEKISTDWKLPSAVANGLCFQNKYDERNRLIFKRAPGESGKEMVYDVRDRLVFTRDGELKSDNQWLVTFYDALNRPVMTALYNSNATRDALQASLNAATTGNTTISYSNPGIADLVVGSHDGRSTYNASNSITFENGFESSATEMLAEIGAGNLEVINITANNILPNLPPSSLAPLTYTFYNNYNYPGKHSPLTTDFTKPQAGSSPNPEPQTTVNSNTRGLVTGTKVRVLGTDQWITTTIYYDEKGRVIQTIADNIGGGRDVVTNLYNFTGRLLSSYQRHTNLRSGVTPQTTVLTMLAYDHAGRVKTVKKRLNDNTALERTITENSYDELGRLQTKRLGVTTSGEMETLNYGYNLRGWLKDINKSFLAPTATDNWYGQEVNYDYGFNASQYNGNVAGLKWKSGTDKIARAYGYSYDNSNRLTVADFTQQNSGSTAWTRDQKDFTVNGIAYDANGNIASMTQKGMVGTGSTIIDQLTYTYGDNSNKLIRVDDPSTTANSKLGDFIDGDNTGDDYTYDLNGNLLADENKQIVAIKYNHLNMPETVNVTGKGTIKFLYDAAGNKLRKITTDVSANPDQVTATDYMGSFVYQNDTLQFVSHEEGRVRTVFKTGAPMTFAYDYFIKDHLGSVRLVLTEQSDPALYAATMETEKTATETALFSNIDETRAAKPVGYPQDNTAGKNTFVARLNAKNGGKKIGPSLVLRVMTGDTIQIGARAFYKSQGPKDSKGPAPVEDMVANLVQAFGGAAASGNTHAAAAAGQSTPFTSNFYSNDYQRLKEKDPAQNRQDKPRSYLNFVLFDDEFKFVEENSGVRQVQGEPDELQTLGTDRMVMKKSGFLYIYTSNESPQDVFFDNVTIAAATGPVLEETHYYPYGLTMAGISNQSLPARLVNRFKFTGQELHNKEFNDGSGLDWYEFRYRMMDPQLGRFMQIDPLAAKYAYNSTYAYAENKVTMGIDLEGLELLPVNSAWFRVVAEAKSYRQFGDANFWREQVNVIADRVPEVFKDDVGVPLFTAGSVGISPRGFIHDSGPGFREPNSLPTNPGWTFGSDDLSGMPEDLSRSAQGTTVGKEWSGSRRLTPVPADPGALKKGTDGLSEIVKWIKLYVIDKPIWDAYNKLRDNQNSFQQAVDMVGAMPIGLSTTPEMRAAVINFVNDGTLPDLNFKDLKGSLQNILTIMNAGMQILQRDGVQVQEATQHRYNMYHKIFKQF